MLYIWQAYLNLQKNKKKGAKLTDWRLCNTHSDIVNFEILVGADHYFKFVNPYRLPIQHSGMWLEVLF